MIESGNYDNIFVILIGIELTGSSSKWGFIYLKA
jgi:hypothetical protein